MHRSRVGVVLIDHPQESYDAAAMFWAATTGTPRESGTTVPDDDPYESLADQPGGGKLELQRTGAGTPPRVHLDVETDDVPAEVARLVSFGATVTTQHEGWVVLADPGGMRFCVVPVQTVEAFAAHATTWP